MAFLCDYIDGELSESEKKSFESYLMEHPGSMKYARKVIAGRKALQQFGKKIKARPGFEARLALRIAMDNDRQRTLSH